MYSYAMTFTPDLEPVADVVIGSRIAHIMWLDDVTQTQMASDMRMDQATLSRKLRGERKWSAAEIVRASKVLRIRIAWLFGEVPEARSDGVESVRPKGLEPLTFWSVVCWHAWSVTRFATRSTLRSDDLALAA
jgi:transcriptional regulator with XRE-family HTH domain